MIRNWSFLIQKQKQKYNRFVIDNIKLEEVDWTNLATQRLLTNLYLIRIKKWKRFYFKNYLLTAGVGYFFAKYRNFFLRRWEFIIFSILTKYTLFFNSFLLDINMLILNKFIFLKILQKNNILFFFQYVHGVNVFSLLNFSIHDNYFLKQNKLFLLEFFTQKYFPADFIFLSRIVLFFSFNIKLNRLSLFNLFYWSFKTASKVPKLPLIVYNLPNDLEYKTTISDINYINYQYLQWSYKIIIFHYLITLYNKLQLIYLHNLLY